LHPERGYEERQALMPSLANGMAQSRWCLTLAASAINIGDPVIRGPVGGLSLTMATKRPKPGCVPVADITEGGLDWQMQLPGDFVAGLLPVDYRVSGDPVGLNVRLSLAGKNVVAQGVLTGALTAVCCRCLAESPFILKRTFRHVFVEGIDPAQDREEEVISETDDLDCTFFAGDEVDLLALGGDELVLALPVNPVCRKDCRGLCPVCGHDRNVSDCGCVIDDGDPRWEALKTLKVDPKN